MLSDELVNGVVLTKRETRALLDNLVELSDLILQTLDDLSSLLFFFLGGFNKLPALLNFATKNSNSIAILLSQFNGSLNLSGILNNRIIQLLTSTVLKFWLANLNLI